MVLTVHWPLTLPAPPSPHSHHNHPHHHSPHSHPYPQPPTQQKSVITAALRGWLVHTRAMRRRLHNTNHPSSVLRVARAVMLKDEEPHPHVNRPISMVTGAVRTRDGKMTNRALAWGTVLTREKTRHSTLHLSMLEKIKRRTKDALCAAVLANETLPVCVCVCVCVCVSVCQAIRLCHSERVGLFHQWFQVSVTYPAFMIMPSKQARSLCPPNKREDKSASPKPL